MKKQALTDETLNKLLQLYRFEVDTSESAINALIHAARIKGVKLTQSVKIQGFWSTVAWALGFKRPGTAIMSGAIGASFALMMGLSLGITNIIPVMEEGAFAVDFDGVIGANTIATGKELSL